MEWICKTVELYLYGNSFSLDFEHTMSWSLPLHLLFLSTAWIKHQTLFPSSEPYFLVRSMDKRWAGNWKGTHATRVQRGKPQTAFSFELLGNSGGIPLLPWLNKSMPCVDEGCPRCLTRTCWGTTSHQLSSHQGGTCHPCSPRQSY